MENQPSRTFNRLHFTDLDPLRFEDLCLNVVSRIQEWKALNHYGRKGSDIGVDIHAVQQVDKEERVWFIQCKRYTSIGKNDITHIIDEVTRNPSLPFKLLIIISCDLTRANHEYGKEYAIQKGIIETEIWTASTLEAKLYKDYKDLLFVYFGVKLERTVKDNAARIRYGLAMEKKVGRDLIDQKYMKDGNHWRTLSYEPFHKFISHKFFFAFC
ncbi:hypothetical protein GO755_29580 [Spirosoma sp. HMF4905]|uniref:Mrr-like domain-containing protein n=1 Tax=Spirosoma arboris TaxID=2682092 RepID=A0A7K1SK81_9BACT|nr:restriction endonuclease [Spirosoma arboris]MVM34219.1 hypothetical protein [Spirosoma arboris]